MFQQQQKERRYAITSDMYVGRKGASRSSSSSSTAQASRDNHDRMLCFCVATTAVAGGIFCDYRRSSSLVFYACTCSAKQLLTPQHKARWSDRYEQTYNSLPGVDGHPISPHIAVNNFRCSAQILVAVAVAAARCITYRL